MASSATRLEADFHVTHESFKDCDLERWMLWRVYNPWQLIWARH